jgi:hypothetical protein
VSEIARFVFVATVNVTVAVSAGASEPRFHVTVPPELLHEVPPLQPTYVVSDGIVSLTATFVPLPVPLF